MYHIYQIGLLLLIRLFISSFFFLSNFQILKFSSHFSQELWGLEGWNLVHTWTVGRCIVYTGIKLLLLICCLIFSFFFLSNFQTLKILSHFSQKLWGLEHWNLVHTMTLGGCIVFTGIKLLQLIHPFIFFYPEVYSGYIVFIFSVTMFVGVHVWVCVGVCVNFFLHQRFLRN